MSNNGLIAALLQQGQAGQQRQMRGQMMPSYGPITFHGSNSLEQSSEAQRAQLAAQQAFLNGDPDAMNAWARQYGATLSYPYGNPQQQMLDDREQAYWQQQEGGLPEGVHRAQSDMKWGIKSGDLYYLPAGQTPSSTHYLPWNGGQGYDPKTGGADPNAPRAPAGWTDTFRTGGAAGGAGAGGLAGAMGGAGGGGFGGALDGAVSGAYQNIINNGGSLFNATERAGAINREGDTYARATNDALQSAREDAVRRGDTTGASLGTVEGRIRMEGAGRQANAQADREMAFKEADSSRLMGALGGATGLISAQAANALASQNFGLNALNTIANLTKSGSIAPSYNYGGTSAGAGGFKF